MLTRAWQSWQTKRKSFLTRPRQISRLFSFSPSPRRAYLSFHAPGDDYPVNCTSLWNNRRYQVDEEEETQEHSSSHLRNRRVVLLSFARKIVMITTIIVFFFFFSIRSKAHRADRVRSTFGERLLERGTTRTHELRASRNEDPVHFACMVDSCDYHRRKEKRREGR